MIAAKMIVTDHFVYIHVSRTGGTFLNRLILDQVPGARMIQYHGHLERHPAAYSHLPVIGFVRNPWDWYVSMFHDYRRKRQFVFQIISEHGALDFESTVARFLNLGNGSGESGELLRHLAAAAPAIIDTRQPGRNHLPGLRSDHFCNYPAGIGYYSWLFNLMFRTSRERNILFGRFENLRKDALRLFEETGAPISKSIADYLGAAPPLNASPRPPEFADAYGPGLARLVAERERGLIERFGYAFPEGARPRQLGR